MLNTTSIVELDSFLTNHETVAKPMVLTFGSVVGGWKVIGFLGSGGTSEVYRVKCLNRGADSPIFAARQKCRAERAALEAAHNLGSVKTGADYERFIANILTGANIPTVRVGQSGDYGADLLANTATGTVVIQCKFYTHPVGYDAVKEVYTAKAIYKASAAFVVSNAAFTTQARNAARELGVMLAHHSLIAELL